MPDESGERVWERYPARSIDHDNRGFYEGWLARELRLMRCAGCGHWHHPPRAICPACWSFEVTPTAVSGDGTVWLTLLLRQGPPADGVEYPYPIVTIDLDEQPGLRFTSAVVGERGRALPIGTRVCLDWVERDGAPVPVFRRADDQRGSDA